MGRIRDLVQWSAQGKWGNVDKEMLENGFNLCTRNLGGSHSEKLENQHTNRTRRRQTIIPGYEAWCDPHLKKYLEKKRKKKKRKQTGEQKQQVAPESFIECTEEVLELKRIFMKHAEKEPVGVNIFYELKLQGDDLLFIFETARRVVNNHRRLHGKPLLQKLTFEKLRKVLVFLQIEGCIRWNEFLLLTTIDIASRSQNKKLYLLRRAHAHYTAHHPVTNETEFSEMLYFINGGVVICDTSHLVTFFQKGDFYKSRGGFTSFPEAVFSLYPHETQIIIVRARARGDGMFFNFSGHQAPGNVGGRAETGYRNPIHDTLEAESGRPRWTDMHTHWKP